MDKLPARLQALVDEFTQDPQQLAENHVAELFVGVTRELRRNRSHSEEFSCIDEPRCINLMMATFTQAGIIVVPSNTMRRDWPGERRYRVFVASLSSTTAHTQ